MLFRTECRSESQRKKTPDERRRVEKKNTHTRRSLYLITEREEFVASRDWRRNLFRLLFWFSFSIKLGASAWSSMEKNRRRKKRRAKKMTRSFSFVFAALPRIFFFLASARKTFRFFHFLFLSVGQIFFCGGRVHVSCSSHCLCVYFHLTRYSTKSIWRPRLSQRVIETWSQVLAYFFWYFFAE